MEKKVTRNNKISTRDIMVLPKFADQRSTKFLIAFMFVCKIKTLNSLELFFVYNYF